MSRIPVLPSLCRTCAKAAVQLKLPHRRIRGTAIRPPNGSARPREGKVHSFGGMGPPKQVSPRLTYARLPCARPSRSPPRSPPPARRPGSRGSPARAAARRCRASCCGSSTPARSTGWPPGSRSARARLGDERQDDDGRDGGRDPPAARSASRTTPRARTSSRASPRRCWRRAAPSWGCSRSTRRRCRRSRAACDRGRSALGNLFRDQLDRYGELELVAERWRDAVASSPPERCWSSTATTRRSASSRAARAGALVFGARRPAPRAAGAPARGRLEVLRALRHAVRRTRRPMSAISATTAARPAATRGRRSTSPRARSSCAGSSGASFDLVDARGRAARRARAAGALQRLQRARRGGARARARRVARRGRARASSASAPRSAASSGSRSATGGCCMLLIKNPAGANEAIRTLLAAAPPRARGRRAERRDRRRPRRLVDLGRRLRAAAERRSTASSRPARARPSWRCASPTAGCRRDRIEVDPELERALDRGLELTPERRRAGRPPHLHGDARRCGGSSAERGHVRPYWERAA